MPQPYENMTDLEMIEVQLQAAVSFAIQAIFDRTVDRLIAGGMDANKAAEKAAVYIMMPLVNPDIPQELGALDCISINVGLRGEI